MSDFVNEFWNWYVIVTVLVGIIVVPCCGPKSRAPVTTGKRWATCGMKPGRIQQSDAEVVDVAVLHHGRLLAGLSRAVPRPGRFPRSFRVDVGRPAQGRGRKGRCPGRRCSTTIYQFRRWTSRPLPPTRKAMGPPSVQYLLHPMSRFRTPQGAKDSRTSPTATGCMAVNPEQIKNHLQRPHGMMPPYCGNPEAIGGASGAKEVANYVRSLSGLANDSLLAAKGRRSSAVCSACHGIDGKGMQAMGAPTLTDRSGSTAVLKPRSSRRSRRPSEQDAGVEGIPR